MVEMFMPALGKKSRHGTRQFTPTHKEASSKLHITTRRLAKLAFRLIFVGSLAGLVWLPIQYCRNLPPSSGLVRIHASSRGRYGHAPKLAGHQQFLTSEESRWKADTLFDNTLYNNGADSLVRDLFDASAPCADFPDTSDVLLVVKTGAGEVFSKLPAQLVTSMQCLPDLLLFSDMEQQIGRYHAFDILDRVNDTVKATHPAFDLYRAQLDCPVSQKDCARDTADVRSLDKYKYLHMLVRTWEMRPNKKWYLFTEADTYVVWSNVMQFVRDLVPLNGRVYAGNPALYDGIRFAHGGTGFLVAGELLRMVVEGIDNLGGVFDEDIEKVCCGDVLVSRVFDAASVSMLSYWPMFNGDKQSTMVFAPHHWCQPLLTMHGLDSEEVSSMWQFERSRKSSEPLLLKDVYGAFVEPHISHRRTDWDNLAEDVCFTDPKEKHVEGDGTAVHPNPDHYANDRERSAWRSADQCAVACQAYGMRVADRTIFGTTAQEEQEMLRVEFRQKMERSDGYADVCLQWRYRKGECCMGKAIRLGVPDRRNDARKWVSGWNNEGIKDWMELNGQCGNPDWVDGECDGEFCASMFS